MEPGPRVGFPLLPVGGVVAGGWRGIGDGCGRRMGVLCCAGVVGRRAHRRGEGGPLGHRGVKVVPRPLPRSGARLTPGRRLTALDMMGPVDRDVRRPQVRSR